MPSSSWVCASLITVGHGDIYPVSDLDRVVVTMPSFIVGVALIALPAGILTGGCMNEMCKEIEKAKSK